MTKITNQNVLECARFLSRRKCITLLSFTLLLSTISVEAMNEEASRRKDHTKLSCGEWRQVQAPDNTPPLPDPMYFGGGKHLICPYAGSGNFGLESQNGFYDGDIAVVARGSSWTPGTNTGSGSDGMRLPCYVPKKDDERYVGRSRCFSDSGMKIPPKRDLNVHKFRHEQYVGGSSWSDPGMIDVNENHNRYVADALTTIDANQWIRAYSPASTNASSIKTFNPLQADELLEKNLRQPNRTKSSSSTSNGSSIKTFYPEEIDVLLENNRRQPNRTKSTSSTSNGSSIKTFSPEEIDVLLESNRRQPNRTKCSSSTSDGSVSTIKTFCPEEADKLLEKNRTQPNM